MRDFERRQHLLDHNPWWREPSAWEEKDRDLRDARLNALGHYNPAPLTGLAASSLFLLMGPRRAGKSVAVKRTIAGLLADGVSPQAIVFCPCETLTKQDLRRVVKLAADLAPSIAEEDRYWFFDEITYVTQWAETLKQLRDHTILRDGCVIATGSSTAKLREAQGDLGGREGSVGDVRVLLPMGFRPFVRELYPDLYAALPQEVLAPSEIQSQAGKDYLEPMHFFIDDISLAWERYLTIGGFPSAVADVAAGGIDVSRGTANSVWNIIVGDVLHVGSMSSRDVKLLMARLVENISSPLSLSNIAQQLDIGARNTVKDRVERVCASLYSWRASVTHDGSSLVRRGQDKLYFMDPLIARLPSLRDSALPAPDMTKLSEQQLGTALLRVISREHVTDLLDESAILVRRNPDSGAEIDFVGGVLGTAIESKYVSKAWKPERQALEEHYGEGVVATRDILDTSERIWAVPAGGVAWMINDY